MKPRTSRTQDIREEQERSELARKIALVVFAVIIILIVGEALGWWVVFGPGPGPGPWDAVEELPLPPGQAW